jgi:hypothetical protein
MTIDVRASGDMRASLKTTDEEAFAEHGLRMPGTPTAKTPPLAPPHRIARSSSFGSRSDHQHDQNARSLKAGSNSKDLLLRRTRSSEPKLERFDDPDEPLPRSSRSRMMMIGSGSEKRVPDINELADASRRKGGIMSIFSCCSRS